MYIDAYLNYLAAINVNSPVTAATDITNDKQEVILRQSTPINYEIVAFLASSRLAQPLELYVQLENELVAADLHDDFVHIIKSDSLFLSHYERHNLHFSLPSYCEFFATFDLLRQKITVMKKCMAGLYWRTLNATLWGIFIAREMRLPQQQIREVFLAALSHDIGMLHIDPQVLHKTESLRTEDWVHIQSHVMLGGQSLLAINNFPADVIAAVDEHHERCDGTGYPLGKVESELSLAGQIIALVDSVVAIYFKHFKSERRSWLDVIPIIQMNAQEYLLRATELLTAIIRRGEVPMLNVVSGSKVSEFIEQLLKQNTRLHQWFTQLRDCLTSVGYTHGDRKLHAMQNVMLHIATSYKGSALGDEAFRLDLNILGPEQHNNLSRAMEDTWLTQHEMLFHLRRLSWMLQLYLTSKECKSPVIALKLQAGLNEVHGYLEQEIGDV